MEAHSPPSSAGSILRWEDEVAGVGNRSERTGQVVGWHLAALKMAFDQPVVQRPDPFRMVPCLAPHEIDQRCPSR